MHFLGFLWNQTLNLGDFPHFWCQITWERGKKGLFFRSWSTNNFYKRTDSRFQKNTPKILDTGASYCTNSTLCSAVCTTTNPHRHTFQQRPVLITPERYWFFRYTRYFNDISFDAIYRDIFTIFSKCKLAQNTPNFIPGAHMLTFSRQNGLFTIT